MMRVGELNGETPLHESTNRLIQFCVSEQQQRVEWGLGENDVMCVCVNEESVVMCVKMKCVWIS